MLLKLLLTLFMIQGSTVSAADPDVNAIPQTIAIAPVTTPSLEQVRLSCMSTLIDTATIVTASHCLPDTLQYIAVRCIGEKSASTVLTPVISLRHHNEQDVAVVRFQVQRRCHTLIKPLQLSQRRNQELAIYSQRSLQLHNLDVLEQQPYHYIVSDDSCLTQGDSGSPVFIQTPEGEIILTAMLISGTDECPSLQILAKLYVINEWLFDTTQP